MKNGGRLPQLSLEAVSSVDRGSKIRPKVLHNKWRNGVSPDWQIQRGTMEARHHFSATPFQSGIECSPTAANLWFSGDRESGVLGL
ncbi:hypothetical protein GX48_05737 [Paracoccidioides brasiliensis]|nr:hypothetical protein GX48_05737 [Paracoccidioides brasiliensis]